MVGARTKRATGAPTAPEGGRERILIEATHLFARKGLDATSLQDVADAVGMRKPSVLWHFRSKEELHRSVLDALLSRWNDALPRLMRAASREDRLDALLDETIAFFSDDPDRARLLLREALDRPDAMRALLTTYVSPWMAVVTDAIARGQKAGVLRADVDPEAYVVMVIHLVIGNVATVGTVSMLALPPSGSARTKGAGRAGAKLPPRIAREIKRVARAALMSE
ncbi:MAG: TetR/AcrR family transcriptional regulator [Myxococcota bacterium]|nr:TetR/AcrR family transcriptional regulator [Myxococcota bacterium]